MEIGKISCSSIGSISHFSVVCCILCNLTSFTSLSLPAEVEESSSEMRRLLAEQSHSLL